jgi:hypothetical protein
MLRRIFTRIKQVIKEEYEWMKTRIWLKSRAVRWVR